MRRSRSFVRQSRRYSQRQSLRQSLRQRTYQPRLEPLEPRRLLAVTPLFRINAGGSAIADASPWLEDSNAVPSQYANVSAGSLKTASTSNTIDLSDPSIPSGTPMGVFQSERWDKPAGEIMKWSFPVTPGDYEVRLYFAETWSGAMAVGARVFDVQIEGAVVLNDLDVFATAGTGNKGFMRSFVVTSDNALNIDFPRQAQNPAIKGIEIYPAAIGEQLTSSATSLDFGNVLVGQSATQSVVLTHAGQPGDPSISIDPTLATIQPTGEPFSFNFAQSTTIVLAPGESTTVDVTYAPIGEQSSSAQLQIPHSGTNSPVTIDLTGTGVGGGISFDKSSLTGFTINRPTSLQFGPDGRLYVSEQDGLIRALTISRNGPSDYVVTSEEVIDVVQNMVNRDDDGTVNPAVIHRLVTGILVTGTAANPVLYVGSSDPRIGGGNSGADLNLDTNSSVISRLTWNGTAWDKVDLVRGMSRSEENHSVNGLQLDPATNTLYVMSGGNTNMGAPSNNFALLPEFALSAALLSIDLNAIDAMPTQLDAFGNQYKYDLPTLDDEDRPGVNDVNDPFGGNNGKNQAVLVPGGPVQVYAPGFRNAYDLVITQNGRMYTVDNGPNAGWGDVPIGEGPAGNATNAVNEPGVTFGDGLHLITGPGYYGGHPNPTRSNPANTFNASNPQSPVSVANPIESDYQIPGVEDQAMVVYGDSTNGIDEYTPSTFSGAMQGDLIIASFDNSVKRVQLDANGAVIDSSNLFSNVGFRPLDVTVARSGPFLGSIWVADIALDTIYVFEPTGGTGGDPNDFDGDCYSNDDEAANGTDPNNPADVPPDHDGDCVSNLLDNDDDNDTLVDSVDPLAIDATNGATTPLSTFYSWENTESPGGLLGLGFTGLMTNGVDDYETLFDTTALTAGGAAGVLTIDSATAGTAIGSANTQQQAFQFGFDAASASAPFSALTRLLAPFSGLTPQPGQQMGFFLGTGDQDNFVQLVISGDNGGEIQFISEVAGVSTVETVQSLPVPGPQSVDLILTVDPATSSAQPVMSVDGGPETNIDLPVSIPSSWLSQPLVTGVIATDPTGSGAMPVTWDFLGTRIEGESPVLVNSGPLATLEGANAAITSAQLLTTDPDNLPAELTYTLESIPVNGSLALDSISLNVGETFTQADVDSGLLAYDHDGSETTSDQFVFHVADATGISLPATTFSIAITPVNDPPVAVDDAANVAQGGQVLLNLIANDTDPDDGIDPTSVVIIGTPMFGTLTDHGNGSVTYSHDGGTSTSDSFTYTMSDITGAVSNTATATINISAVSGYSAVVTIDPGGDPDSSSTFKASSFSITNTSDAGLQIATITIDLSTAILPDVVFDPFGTAGDPVGKEFTPDSGAIETGQISHLYLGVHDGGFDALQIDFDQFDPGETFTFSIDIDPTSIQGAPQPGPEHSGSISGLELSGSEAVVTFQDSTTLTRATFAIAGSSTGSQANVQADVPIAPALSMLGVSTIPSVVTDAVQTVRITGLPGSQVRFVQTESALHLAGVPGGGFDIDPFESNKFLPTTIIHQTVTLDQAGIADVPVTLTKTHAEGGLNYFFAATEDATGIHSDMSTPLLVEFEPGPIGGIDGDYFFSSSNPASATGSDAVTISFDDSDIVQMVRQPDGSFVYQLYFDGSDVGLTTFQEDIDAFAILSDGSLLISTNGNVSVPGVDAVKQDVLRFVPTSTGDVTSGSWELYFDGSDVGLDTDGENISGISVLSDGTLAIATQGGISASGLTTSPQDLALFTPTQLGSTTIGGWSLLLDGASQGLTTNGEKIDAVSTTDAITYDLSTQGTFSAGGVTGNDEDVVRLTNGLTELLLDADVEGITSKDIDAWHTQIVASGAASIQALAIDTGETVSIQSTGQMNRKQDLDSQIVSEPEDPFDSRDVNLDGAVTTLDALVIINALTQPNYDLAANWNRSRPDIDGNGEITARDALLVIHRLAQPSAAMKTEQAVIREPATSGLASDWRVEPDEDDELLTLLANDQVLQAPME